MHIYVFPLSATAVHDAIYQTLFKFESLISHFLFLLIHGASGGGGATKNRHNLARHGRFDVVLSGPADTM